MAAMTDGSRTWALVVGIDVYADHRIPPLTGAANDAIAAVQWLRALGVPDQQILLHVAPCDAALPNVLGSGLPYSAATLDEIWSSVGVLEEHSGDRLFVFLSGHGFYEPTRGRLFLTQNARQRSMTNLGIDLWIAYLRSLPYEWQFLVMDGCQNYPYTPTQRMKVEAALYPGVAVPTPKPGNSMVALFAASQGEIVPEIGGRGIYLRRFFEYADPTQPHIGAVTLDFGTGHKSVSARLLHSLVSRAAAADSQALRPPVPVHPGIVLYGRAESLDDVTLFGLPDEPTSAIDISVKPPGALANISGLRLRSRRPPYWERRLPVPPETVVAVPVGNRLPRGLDIVVDLTMTSGAQWAGAQVEVNFSSDLDREVSIDLDDLARRLPVTTAGEESAVILTVDHKGMTIYNLISDPVYDDLERQAFGTIVAGQPVQLTRHESGPDLVLATADGTGRALVGTVAERILQEVPAEVSVTTAVRRDLPDTTAIRLVLTAKEAIRLAGPLWLLPTVSVAAPGAVTDPIWRSGEGRSLKELVDHPFVTVPSGASEIRVDFPWGSWSNLVDVTRDTVVPVALPHTVGLPPLRAVLANDWPYQSSVVVAGEVPPSSALLVDVRRDRERPLEARIAGSAGAWTGWAYELPAGQRPAGQRLIHLAWPGGPCLRFPARLDGVLGVQIQDGSVRVEPLVHFQQPLWDLLVTTGRLDALTAEESHELSYGKWEDPILGLAAAYALQTTHPELVPTIIRNLRRLGMDYPDLVVLEAIHGLAGLDQALAREAALSGLAAFSAVPVLRWGIPMARVLVSKQRSRSPSLKSWDRFLARIERRLSATSIWTAWSSIPSPHAAV